MLVVHISSRDTASVHSADTYLLFVSFELW